MIPPVTPGQAEEKHNMVSWVSFFTLDNSPILTKLITEEHIQYETNQSHELGCVSIWGKKR